MLLNDWALPNADIHAIYLERHQLSAKLRTFVEFLGRSYARRRARQARLKIDDSNVLVSPYNDATELDNWTTGRRRARRALWTTSRLLAGDA